MGLTQKLGTIPLAIQTDSSNNVGIGGAANASYKLAVTGASLFTGAGSFSSSVGIGATAGTNGLFEVSNLGAGVTVGDFLVDAANKNVYVGRLSSTSNDNTNFIVRNRIGTAALYVQGNTGNVGIGTSSPSVKLDILGNVTSSTDNTIIRLFNNTGENCGNIDFDNVFGNLARITGTKMGGGSSADDGLITFSTAQNSVLGERMRITSGGNVGIGVTSPSSVLEANGDICVVGSGASLSWANRSGSGRFSWYAPNGNFTYLYNLGNIGQFSMASGVYTALSDVNKKKDFEDSTIGLEAILGLKPTLYRMKNADENSDKELGFIAQQVKEFIPQAYMEDGEGEDKFIGLSDRPIIAALVKAIQELNAKVTALENK